MFSLKIGSVVLGKRIFLNSKETGNITIEASIMFSALFFCIVILMYICLLLYHQSCLESIAVRAAQRAVATWSDLNKDMYIEKVSFQNNSTIQLYYSIYDSEKDKKKARVCKYVSNYYNPYKILKSNNFKVDIEVKNYLLYKKIKVSISEGYDLYIEGIMKIFGLSSIFRLNGSAERIINEPVELINNVDFLIETGKETDRKYFQGKTGSSILEIGEKIKQIIDKIKGFL
jgi:hypothetical protein